MGAGEAATPLAGIGAIARFSQRSARDGLIHSCWNKLPASDAAQEIRNAQAIYHVLMPGVRLDKWLWAARFFKTRSMAGRACELGRIQSKGQPVKSGRDIHVGDMLQIRTEGGDFEVEVLQLSDIRGPASVAQALYRETDASRGLRAKVAAERKAMMQFNPAPTARPSKRDRRKIMQYRSRRDRQ